MIISVILELPGWNQVQGGKKDFWGQFESLNQGEISNPDKVYRIEHDVAERYENKFRLRFPEILQSEINNELDLLSGEGVDPSKTEKTASKGRKGTDRTVEIQRIKVRLMAVDYGSLKSVLEIVGVDSPAIRDFVIMAVGVFAPIAFRSALQTDLTVSADVSVIHDGNIKSRNKVEGSKIYSVADKAWLIANTSLLVPVLLALAVLYYANLATRDEINADRAAATEIMNSSANLVKTLTDQNNRLSTSLIALLKDSAMKSERFDQIVLKIVEYNFESLKLKSGASGHAVVP